MYFVSLICTICDLSQVVIDAIKWQIESNPTEIVFCVFGSIPVHFWHGYEKFRMMTSPNGNISRVTGPLCGEFTSPGEFPAQRPVTRSLDVFFDLRLNKRLSKQPWGWWFETPSWSLWRQCNEFGPYWHYLTGIYVCVCIWIIMTKREVSRKPSKRVQWQCERVLGTYGYNPVHLWH